MYKKVDITDLPSVTYSGLSSSVNKSQSRAEFEKNITSNRADAKKKEKILTRNNLPRYSFFYLLLLQSKDV